MGSSNTFCRRVAWSNHLWFISLRRHPSVRVLSASERLPVVNCASSISSVVTEAQHVGFCGSGRVHQVELCFMSCQDTLENACFFVIEGAVKVESFCRVGLSVLHEVSVRCCLPFLR